MVIPLCPTCSSLLHSLSNVLLLHHHPDMGTALTSPTSILSRIPQTTQSVLSIIVTAACIAVVKADYFIQGIYDSKATCDAEGIPTQAILDVIDSSLCASIGGGMYNRAGCKSNGDSVLAIFSGNTCADSTFLYNTTGSLLYKTCEVLSGSPGMFTAQKCYSGPFTTKIPVAIQQSFSDDKCTEANGPISKAYKRSTLYPLNTCFDSGTSSSKYTCSGGKPSATVYGATKCTGSSLSQPFPTDCTANPASSGGGSYRWASSPTCVSSGAASTSVTFLALGLLVLATFSSAM